MKSQMKMYRYLKFLLANHFSTIITCWRAEAKILRDIFCYWVRKKYASIVFTSMAKIYVFLTHRHSENLFLASTSASFVSFRFVSFLFVVVDCLPIDLVKFHDLNL